VKVAALLLALLAAAPAQPLPPATQAVRAAIAHEAAASPGVACVSPRLGQEFESTQMVLAVPVGSPQHPIADFRWARADASPEQVTQLRPDEASELNRSLTSVLGQPARARARLRPADVPRPFRLAAGKCRTTFFFSSPAMLEDTAFVEVSYTCPGLCGGSWLLALRRIDATWKVVAVAGLLVS